MNPIILNPATTLDMSLQGLKLIEASAGTGKTFAIGNLYLRMMLEGKSTEDILVVTFTNAATEELRGRIRARIQQALKYLQANMPDDCGDELLKLWHSRANAEDIQLAQQRLKVAMTSMDRAAIYTIHAFCQKMLTEHAFYSQQAFEIEMLTDDRMLWEEALKDWWRNQIASQDEETFPYFQNAFHSLNDVMTLQKSLRQPSVKLLPIIHENSSVLIQGLKVQKERLLQVWSQEKDDIISFFKSTACVRKALASKWQKILTKKDIPKLCENITEYLSGEVASLPMGLGAFNLQVLEPALKSEDAISHISFFNEVSVFFRMLDNVKAGLLHEVHGCAKEAVAHIKQQSGQLAFDDQLLHLHDAVLKSSELCTAIRERFPIALIDEFQDTDSIQYGIFHQLYHQQKALTLMMIGDPKQAIYSFRGGDIFIYMRAKKDADEHYTLDTNWRSTPAMISAVNHLFYRHQQPFFYDAIPFEPVQIPNKEPRLLYHQKKEVKALSLWQVPYKGDKKMNKADARALLHECVANEIATLLQQAEHGALTLGENNVVPSDIAVLTRGHEESAAVRQALQARGIAAVSAGKAHIFQSDEAKGLRIILKAILEQGNTSILREAMSSSLLGNHYDTIYQQWNTEDSKFQWQETFKILHALWEQQGFMVMFQSLLRNLHMGEYLAAQADGERQLTNLLQLAELLQHEAQSSASMISLLTWFEEQCQKADERSDEAQLRLENDGDLVKISTIHAAKGLEYPIVFVPYLWDCKPRTLKPNKLLAYYDEGKKQHYLELNADLNKLKQAEKERLAEDMRLLYVALTRASHKLYVAWGEVGTDSSKSALTSLLNPKYHKEDTENHQDIEVQTLTLEAAPMVSLAVKQASADTLATAGFSRTFVHDRGISSFTKLTRSIHPQKDYIETPDGIQDAIFQLPSNRNMGICLHALLENMDFQADIHTQSDAFLQKHGVRYGIHEDQHDTIKQWMHDVIHTVLPTGLCLKDIPKSQRLNELHFDMCLSQLKIHRLNQTLQQASTTALQDLVGADCRGYLTGEIDLVFEHGGRYYIADYKSNHLGYSLDDYQPQALQASIFSHRYDLQYLIYTVALHRYLKLRISDYNYEQHFGGVYYLFLRGMRGKQASNHGVFAHKPDVSLIETLNHDIFGEGASQ